MDIFFIVSPSSYVTFSGWSEFKSHMDHFVHSNPK